MARPFFPSSLAPGLVIIVMVLMVHVDCLMGGVQQCSEFVASQNLNLAEAMSNHTVRGWLTLKGTEPRVACLNYEFEADLISEPSVILVNLEFLALDSRQRVTTDFEAIVPNLRGEPGVWTVSDSEGNLAYNFYILYLDHDYSLTVQCSVIEEGESRVHFNTRGNQDHLPLKMVQKFWAILQKEYGLDISDYHQVNHDPLLCHQFEDEDEE